MDFGTLALIVAAGLIGPLLSVRSGLEHPDRARRAARRDDPAGGTGFGWLDTTDRTFSFLADIGFALVMFVAGSHVPVRDPILRARDQGRHGSRALRSASSRPALGIAHRSAVRHRQRAALRGADGVVVGGPDPADRRLAAARPDRRCCSCCPQVAVADAACIVALPLVIDPARARRAALGALRRHRRSRWCCIVALRLGRRRPRPAGGCTGSPSDASSPSNCGSASRPVRVGRRRDGHPRVDHAGRVRLRPGRSRRSANRAGSPSSCSRSPRVSSGRCSSSGWARR